MTQSPDDPTNRGQMFTVGGWRHTFQRAAKSAGLKAGITPNDLRHTAVAWAVELGANMYHVQQMVGHAKPSITLDVYRELWDEGQERLADRMDAALMAEAASTPTDAHVVSL